jgi:outer membrane protein OmpA-like peptidoglycan-associated protein
MRSASGKGSWMRSFWRGVSERPSLVQGFAVAAAMLALAGCTNPVGSYDPVAWWHQLEGGRIAQARPPPPGIDAPYPNLATIPAKPQALSPTARAETANALLADRANGNYALSAPLPAPPPAPAAPPTPAPNADAMGARMAAAGETGPAAPAGAASPARAAPVAGRDESESLAIPAGPPPPARLPGVPWLTKATPPPVAPPIPPAPPPGGTGKPVAVSFPRGSAVLSTDDALALKQLAAKRAASVIAVTGYGDAAGSDPPVQGAALGLAWARAQAIVAALRLDGVPDTAMTVTAFAPGGGGAARLLPAG